MMFRSSMQRWAKRKLKDIWYRGFAAGYRQGHEETLEFFANQVIAEIHHDAVLSMTADLDTLERIVEIIEAVRDNGETQRDKSED
jgi:flagellar biosynthesis/type III secretory pathway protein FliH